MNEFEFIQRVKDRFHLGRVGDDCAVLPKDGDNDLLITADLLIEDIDFQLDWTKPGLLGHKSLAVSLSDIAAMGGTPVWAMISLGVPEDLWKSDFLDQFYEGWQRLARELGVELVGGDVSKSPDKLVIDSIVVGKVSHGKALLRSGASAGETIAITGTMGGAAGGLQLLRSNHRIMSESKGDLSDLIAKQLQPQPQITIAKLLNTHALATAAIDVSDGVSSDVGQLCRASGVGGRIYADKLPIHPGLADICKDPDAALDLALNGGEDFELLFTVPSEKLGLLADIQNVTIIGETTDEPGRIEIVKDGRPETLEPHGFRHF